MSGANYEDSHTYDQIDETYPKNSVALFFKGTSIYARQDIRNYAFFGNGEYDILPELTFKAGVRYTNSRNNADNCTGDIGDGSAEIGRVSCRERVCKYVWVQMVAAS